MAIRFQRQSKDKCATRNSLRQESHTLEQVNEQNQNTSNNDDDDHHRDVQQVIVRWLTLTDICCSIMMRDTILFDDVLL